MNRLSTLVTEELISALRAEMDAGRFSGVTFGQAMEFLLTDGTFPESDLPVASFLESEDWVRRQSVPKSDD